MTKLEINLLNTENDIPLSEWKKLQKIWENIEKKKDRNIRHEIKLDRFFSNFKTQLEIIESDICLVQETLALHLFTFLNKKTLRDKEKFALQNWILELIENIESNPFRKNDIQDLKKKLNTYYMTLFQEHEEKDTLLNQLREEFETILSTVTGKKQTLDDEELYRLMEDKNNIIEIMQERLECEKEEIDETITTDDTGPELNSKNENKEKNIEDFFDSKTMTKLYRQLAREFHPDKEQNTDKKEIKKDLMQQLSQAKKEKDTFSMILLAQHWLPNFELTLDKNTLHALKKALKEKLRLINQEHKMMQEDVSIVNIIWERFGKGSKSVQTKRTKEYKENRIQHKETLSFQLKNIKTIKDIRNEIHIRQDQTH